MINSEVQIPNFLLGPLCQILNGELVGDAEFELTGFSADPEKAKDNELCFVFSKKYLKLLNEGKLHAGAYIVPADSLPSVEGINYIAVKRPKYAIKQLLELVAPKRHKMASGVHSTAVLGENVSLGEGVKIGPHVYIADNTAIGDYTELQAGVRIGANVVIGKKCLLRSNVVIEDNCKLANNIIIHPNTVIGADGYSYITAEPTPMELLQKKPSAELSDLFNEDIHMNNPQEKVIAAGNVIIADNVEIGSNTCIDRGTLGPTYIGAGTKIDNLVQIAHNCKIGKDCLIVSQSGLAGSSILEDRVVVAGHSGCKDGITLGHDSILLAASHANRDAQPFSLLGGDPAIPAKEYIEREKTQRRTIRDVAKLKKQVAELQGE